jgi:hypothetical protein
MENQPTNAAQEAAGVLAPSTPIDARTATTISPLARTFALWGTVSLVLALLIIWGNTAPSVLRAGFFMKTLAVLVATGLGATGAVIGDALRKFTRPDAFYTSGGMGQILWLKLFWMCGPQLIGLCIGVVMGFGFVLR